MVAQSIRRALVLLVAPLAPLLAQGTLRVLTVLPARDLSPGEAITITFDRPVVATLDGASDPARLLHFEPTLDARIEWRDPSSIRILPLVPPPAGSRFTVSFDSLLTALDGARLDPGARLTLRMADLRLLASNPPLRAEVPVQLSPHGRLLLRYSGPMDVAALQRVVRLELSPSSKCARAGGGDVSALGDRTAAGAG